MILRLSLKLSTKIKAGALPTLPPDENPFADWSAHLFVADRTQYILLSNTKSLYSMVMYAKGITSDSHFIERALSSIRDFMEDDGQQNAYEQVIAASSSRVRFAKSFSRAVTGSMNELVMAATSALVMHDKSPHEVGFDLNNLWLSAIAPSKSEKYGQPREAFQTMIATIESEQSTKFPPPNH